MCVCLLTLADTHSKMNTFSFSFFFYLFGEADLGDSLVGEAKSWERVGKQKCGEERDFPSFPACPPTPTPPPTPHTY